WCRKLEGKWMDSLRKIKTLDLVDIVGSKMLVERWAEMEMEEGQEPCHFTVRTGRKEWKNVETVVNKAASKLLSGECLLTDSRGEPFSLSTLSPNTLLLVIVVADEEGRKHFSNGKILRIQCEFFLSNSTLYFDLQKLTESPLQESNVRLLKALFADNEESTTSSIFVRNYTENIAVDQLHGKTVLLLISDMDEHPFQSLKDIYSKVKSSDDVEILSIPIPVDVRGRPRQRLQHQVEELPDSDLAGFEIILRNVPWPVLRNPWSLKTEVYYFFEREWGELNPGRLVVVDPNGKICNKNALPLVDTWEAQVYPFSEENMNQLEQQPLEELLGEYILDGLFENWSKYA
ncbi:hypothetical protein KI387_008020, partial [Taxus chinensis]